MPINEIVRRGTFEIFSTESGQRIALLVYENIMEYSQTSAELKIPVRSPLLKNRQVELYGPFDIHYFRDGEYLRSDIREHPSEHTEPLSITDSADQLFPARNVVMGNFQIPTPIKAELRNVADPHMKATIEIVIGKYL